VGYIVGTLATLYVAALWIVQRTCDTGTCVHVPTWRWILFGVIGIVGLGYSLGPWWHKRDSAGSHQSLREAMQKPRLPRD
jgi:hypothetical protein